MSWSLLSCMQTDRVSDKQSMAFNVWCCFLLLHVYADACVRIHIWSSSDNVSVRYMPMVKHRKLSNDKHICYRRHVNSCGLHDWPSVCVCCDQTGYVCHVLPVYCLLVHMCICVYVCVCVRIFPVGFLIDLNLILAPNGLWVLCAAPLCFLFLLLLILVICVGGLLVC